ncbi:Retrovirus-related Pol polyprotein from transposon TNT 1-94, partial [Durusdinium trenchii]
DFMFFLEFVYGGRWFCLCASSCELHALANSHSLQVRPNAVQDQAAELAVEPMRTGTIFETAISKISDRSYEENRTRLYNLAVGKWHSILKSCLIASDVGRKIAALDEHWTQSQETEEIIRAVLGVRSPTTAISRANAILRFLRWSSEMPSSADIPYTEDFAWKYVCFLKDSGYAPTSASSLLSACRYAFFVFGFECMEEIINSKRVQGLSDILFSAKRFLKQARILSVLQVKALHTILSDEGFCNLDRAAAGYLIVALYGRCRHSDLEHVHCVLHDYSDDGGFVEIQTAVHKNARSAQKKNPAFTNRNPR